MILITLLLIVRRWRFGFKTEGVNTKRWWKPHRWPVARITTEHRGGIQAFLDPVPTSRQLVPGPQAKIWCKVRKTYYKGPLFIPYSYLWSLFSWNEFLKRSQKCAATERIGNKWIQHRHEVLYVFINIS